MRTETAVTTVIGNRYGTDGQHHDVITIPVHLGVRLKAGPQARDRTSVEDTDVSKAKTVEIVHPAAR